MDSETQKWRLDSRIVASSKLLAGGPPSVIQNPSPGQEGVWNRSDQQGSLSLGRGLHAGHTEDVQGCLASTTLVCRLLSADITNLLPEPSASRGEN